MPLIGAILRLEVFLWMSYTIYHGSWGDLAVSANHYNLIFPLSYINISVFWRVRVDYSGSVLTTDYREWQGSGGGGEYQLM